MHYANRCIFENYFSGNLVVFCSDERFVKATLELLKEIGLSRFDLMVLPGGPLFIKENDPNLISRINTLIELHKVKDIVLVSHEDCGYYKKIYPNLNSTKVKDLQINDLKEITQKLNRKNINAQAYYAHIRDGKIVFEKINL